MLPDGGDCLLQEFPRRTVRHFAAAIEMAHRRRLRRELALHALLYRAVRVRCGAKHGDEILCAEPGADPTVFWLRDHSLPLDGCGHYLQAPVGVHVVYCWRGGGGFCGVP